MSEDLPDGFNMDAYGASFGNDNDDWHEIYPIRSLHPQQTHFKGITLHLLARMIAWLPAPADMK
jgi:hypothetical protein